MSNFKVGQKVVCIHEDNSDILNIGLDDTGPMLHEIVTINYIGANDLGLPCLEFYEYPNDNACWDEWQFRPLDHAFADEVEAMIKEQVKQGELETV